MNNEHIVKLTYEIETNLIFNKYKDPKIRELLAMIRRLCK